MLLVSGLKILLSLRQLSQRKGRLAIFVGTIRQIGLLIVGVGSVVGGAIEFSSHENKIIKSRIIQGMMLICTCPFYIYPIKLSSMNYNELTFHKANPFYKQDFMPDRAWFNRQAKEYPSEMPSGKDFFVDSGRKHFINRFNHSEIEHNSILKSPERYPFENRIAFDKTYMRSLHTIDIEGASSNTRVNQSIKNKYKAQDELARRYNQSVDLGKAKEKTEEQRRRDVALRQFEDYQQRKVRLENPSKTLDDSNITAKTSNPEKLEKPSLQRELSDQYKRFVMQNSSNKFSKDIPQPQPADNLDSSRMYKDMERDYRTIDTNLRRYNSSDYEKGQPQQIQRKQSMNYEANQPYSQNAGQSQARMPNQNTVNPAPTPSSHYQYQFNGEKLKNKDEYQRILKYEEMSRNILQNPKDFRKNNPTNLSLSFNLAGQSIVSS